MTLSRYTNDSTDAADPGRLNISLEDARTMKRLADAALEQDVREPELVAARAAPRVSITDAATATVAAAEDNCVRVRIRPRTWSQEHTAGARGAGERPRRSDPGGRWR